MSIPKQIDPPKWPKTHRQRQIAIARHLKTNKQQLLQRCHQVLRKTPGARLNKELELLVDFTVNINFFKDKFEHVGDRFHVELCRRIRHRNCKFDEYIIKQGEIGDEMYVIISGAVRVELIRTVLGEPQRAEVLITLGPGDGFGELALLNDAPRAASCIVSSLKCEVMVIQRRDFAEILQQSHIETLKKRKLFLRAIPLFRTLSHEKLVVVASHMNKHLYGRHDIIIKEGEHADGLFIITKGTARVFKKADDVLLQLSVLHTGDIFGELGVVLPGSKRTASVVADSTKTECLELSRSDFFEFLSNYQDLMLDECLSRYPTDIEIMHQVALHQKWIRYKRSLTNHLENDTKLIPSPPPVSALRHGSSLNAIAKLRKERRRRLKIVQNAGVYSTARKNEAEAKDVAEKQLNELRKTSRRNSLNIHEKNSGSTAITHVLRHTVGARFNRRLSLKMTKSV
jgi:cAMP-dependent protein kinase regulator